MYELELFKMLAVEVATLEELDDEDAATFVKMVVEAQNEVLGLGRSNPSAARGRALRDSGGPTSARLPGGSHDALRAS